MEMEIIKTVAQLSATVGAIWWLLKGLKNDLKELEQKYHSFKDEVHKEYVRKEDLNRTEDKIAQSIEKLSEDIKHLTLSFYNDILRRLSDARER